jgi:glycine betaine/proline transport system substrate-binding protein
MTLRSALLSTAVTFALAGSAFAEGCDAVIFSDVGWTDITATTAATTLILEALGYETETKVLSVPVTYTGLAEGDIDVFLGNWMPSMEADIAPYREAGTVETVRANLEGAKYTLATNEHGAALGIADFRISRPRRMPSKGRSTGSSPATTATVWCWKRSTRQNSAWTDSRSSKARNRACWPKSRRPRKKAGRSSFSPGNRTR